LLVSTLGASGVSAQMQITVGVRAGVNIANSSYTSTMSGVSESARTGLAVGGVVALRLSENMCVRTEPMYVQNGATMTMEGVGFRYTETFKLEYLELPVHFVIDFGDGAVQPYLFGGPNFGILITATLEEDIPPPAIPEPEIRVSGTRDIKDQFSSNNFAIDLGAGVAYDVTLQMRLLVDVRYSLGLINNATAPDPRDQSFQAESWKSRDVKILVGVMFAL